MTLPLIDNIDIIFSVSNYFRDNILEYKIKLLHSLHDFIIDMKNNYQIIT